MDRKIFTQSGLDKLKKELDVLKTEKRHQVADRIKQAKEFGDLSENAEYAEAKEEQAYVEGRILELEHLVKTAVVAEARTKDIVSVGCEVLVDKEGKELHFSIVGSTEADPASGKISFESPLGQALLDHKVDDEVEVESPAGKVRYKILEIK